MPIFTNPLFPTDDWTITGKVVTFLVTPVDGDAYFAEYAVAVPNDDVLHTHSYEAKSVWTGGATTWTLTDTPLDGSLQIFQAVNAEYLWAVYGDDNTSSTHNAKVRRARVSPTDSTFVVWDTPEIDGFVGNAVSTERLNAIAAHPTDKNLVYVATQQGGDDITAGSLVRIYAWRGIGTTLTLVQTINTVKSVGQLRILSDGSVWLCARYSGSAGGVWGSDTSGSSFALRGTGFGSKSSEGGDMFWVGTTGSGISSLIVLSPSVIWTVHTRCQVVLSDYPILQPADPVDDIVVSFSLNGGATWTGMAHSSRDKFSNGGEFPVDALGSIGVANGVITYSYWHFAQFVDLPKIAGTPVGAGALSLANNIDGSVPFASGAGVAVCPDNGDISYGAFGSPGAWAVGPAGLGSCVLRGLTAHPSKTWAVLASFNHTYLQISTDSGHTFGTQITLPQRAKLATYLGGQ